MPLGTSALEYQPSYDHRYESCDEIKIEDSTLNLRVRKEKSFEKNVSTELKRSISTFDKIIKESASAANQIVRGSNMNTIKISSH